MVGWEVSRHPEWDLMYAAGLTSAEIAVHCHAPRTTVQQHFVMREKYEPGTLAIHEAALLTRTKPWATRTWLARMTDAQAFHAEHGRLPRIAGDRHEKALALWLRDQRWAHAHGTLNPQKTEALAVLGNWTPQPRQVANDTHWRNQLAELQNYMATTGETPHYRRHRSQREHALGVWLHTQTQKRARGKLQPWRLEALNAALGEWHSTE